MATNPYVNQVLLADGTTVIDISDTTAVASDVAIGKYFYTASGEKVEGTSAGGGSAISIVDTQDSAGGNIRTITAVDISDTTAIASDVAQGKYFYTADGTKTLGTASGSPSVTQHSIYFEFDDSTNTTIDVYYDDSILGTMITDFTPTTYGGKMVVLAKLDGVTWYEYTPIPIGVELVDFTSLTPDVSINSNGEAVPTEWMYTTDYTPIESDMTFSYTCCYWFYIGVYDENKNFVRSIYCMTDGTQDSGDSNLCHGTLSGNKINGGKYIRMTSPDDNVNGLSLVRTA